MVGVGTVVASIPANVAIDAFGNPNQASTSTDNTVSYDFPTNPVGWTNVGNPLDVTNDGTISALDALRIINELNSRRFSDRDGKLQLIDTVPPNPPSYVDVTKDGFVSPRDVLLVIIHLNRKTALLTAPVAGRRVETDLRLLQLAMTESSQMRLLDGSTSSASQD